MTKIAIQGGVGSFHYEATQKLFQGEDFIIEEKEQFREVAKAVYDEKVEYGVMALENSIAGTILPNYNLIIKYDLYIVKELYLPISMCLMALEGVEIENLEEVYSHPIALLQCENYLEKTPHIKRIEYKDTAKSAEKIRTKNLLNAAAIASESAAELYNLNIIQKNIQTNKANFTRFVVLSKKKTNPVDYNKASVIFTLPHKTGSLANALMQFTVNQLSLTKIQSLPIKNEPFKYAFYIDVLVNNITIFDNTLAILERMTENLKIVGKFNKGN